jgi:SAM-dependent methyltransferase
MTEPLKPDHALEASAVVANCRMNRERELAGGNSYQRDLGFSPLDFLRTHAAPGHIVRWLDLCCGSGRALLQATELLQGEGRAGAVAITGVDLVPMFWPGQPPPCLRLRAASAHTFDPGECFDLITCVHGLHYLGDKLQVITRAVSWLTSDGLFAAHFDLATLRGADGGSLARRAAALFRSAGMDYDRRRRVLSCRGQRELRFPLVYLGADDTAGPNWTGQEAVHSHYRPVG